MDSSVIAKRESALLGELRYLQGGIDDRTGKGSAAEQLITDALLVPYLPPGFACGKGSVVNANEPDRQSAAIDRVVYHITDGVPLVFDPAHSIFPAEIVAGTVEITLCLNARKLARDIEHVAEVKSIRERWFWRSVRGTRTRVERVLGNDLNPRTFLVGLPVNAAWTPTAIARSLHAIQQRLGPPTHVHGLYVVGTGFFETVPRESDADPLEYHIRGWSGDDRLFRFTDAFRRAFDRWGKPDGLTADMSPYVPGEPDILV